MRSAPLLLAVVLGCGQDQEDTQPPATGCGASAAALAECVDAEAYQADLVFVAQERPPGSEHHQAVQDLCASRFEELGLTVERHDYGSGVNVLGHLQGESDSRVLVTAHYDHIMGCPGADDNGSGVAGVLEAARVLTQARFEHSLVFACWDEEERGLVGARAYAQRAVEQGESIVTVFNFEMIGYLDDTPGAQSFPAGLDALFPEAWAQAEANDMRGDFLAVIGDEGSAPAMEALESHAELLDLPLMSIALTPEQATSAFLSDLRRSDHAPFWDAGISAMMLTDTSEFRYPAYHCRDGDDTVDKLDQGFARRNIAATVGAVADLAGLIGG